MVIVQNIESCYDGLSSKRCELRSCLNNAGELSRKVVLKEVRAAELSQ